MKLAAPARRRRPSSTARGCRRPSRCGASSRRSSSRPTAWRSSRAGPRCAARTSTACSARLLPAAGRACRRSTPRRSRSATPRCGACSSACSAARSSRRGRSASPSSARRSSRRAARPRSRALARLPRSAGGARPSGRARSATTPSRRPPPRSRRGSTPTSRAARPGLGPHLDDVEIASDGRDLRELRLAGRAAARAARAPARRGRAPALAAAAAARRRALGARLAPPRASWPSAVAGLEQIVITATHRSRAARRAEPGRGGDPWTGCLSTFARELSRFGRRPTSARSCARWPDAVGRGDRAQRVAGADRPRRDAARQHRRTRSGRSSSAHRAAEIAARLGVAAIRFAPGPLAEHEPEDDRRVPRARARTIRAGAARGRRDRGPDRGRGAARKCAKSGAFRASQGPPVRPPRSDTLYPAAKQRVLQAFFYFCDYPFLVWRSPKQTPPTPQRTSRSSKASSRSGCGPACTSARHGLARPPSPRLRGRRQRRRRGDGGPQRLDRGDDPSRTTRSRCVDHGRGIPVDVVDGTGPAGADGRPDEAPRRRQVRRRGLQGLRRPPRRRRLGRERALGVARGDGRARRQGLPAGVRARRARRAR